MASIGQILWYLILIAIIVIMVVVVSKVFIIILIIVLVMYLINGFGNSSSPVVTEGFNPWLDYSRAYPGTFSYKYGYGQYYRPFYNSWPGNINYIAESWMYPGNVRYNPGYSDYWYIPAHEYLNNWINGPDGRIIPTSCLVKSTTDNACVQQKVQETGNLDLSIAVCTKPAAVSDACPLLQNWSGPIQAYNN
jgi:hypothetical protein